MATVRMMIRLPEDRWERGATLVKTQLSAKDTRTSPAMILLFRAGGMNTAMNMP